MSVVTPSATAAQYLASLSIGQQRFDLTEQSDTNGHTATRLLAPPRWRLAMSTLDALEPAVSALWKAIAVQLRGRVNHLAMWDITQPAPRGTARGTMLTSGTTAAGATSATISGVAAGSTLLAGDWLQIGSGVGTSHYLMVTADATANGSGVIVVTFEPPTRIAFAGSTAVTWDKPVAYFKQTPDSLSWSGAAGSSDVGGFAFDLLESWR